MEIHFFIVSFLSFSCRLFVNSETVVLPGRFLQLLPPGKPGSHRLDNIITHRLLQKRNAKPQQLEK